MKKYCVGFMFSDDQNKVALIRKNKPEWQAGKLNGIGGSVEIDENSEQAQVREFIEEAGVATGWQYFATKEVHRLNGKEVEPYTVDCYVAIGDLTLVKAMTAEKIEIHEVSDLQYRSDLIPSLRWLIPLALENLQYTVLGEFKYI